MIITKIRPRLFPLAEVVSSTQLTGGPSLLSAYQLICGAVVISALPVMLLLP